MTAASIKKDAFRWPQLTLQSKFLTIFLCRLETDVMTPSPEQVEKWLADIRNGELTPEAADEIWRNCSELLIRRARFTLNKKAGRHLAWLDSTAAARSAMRRFEIKANNRKFTELHNWNGILQLLVLLTDRKSAYYVRRARTNSRGGQETFVFTDMSVIPDRLRDPAAVAEFKDLLEDLIDSLSDPTLKTIARMHLDGYQNVEIAEKIGWSSMQISRKLDSIRNQWKRRLDDDEFRRFDGTGRNRSRRLLRKRRQSERRNSPPGL